MKVRCWKFREPRAPAGAVFATFPSGNTGYDLYICINCGHIYAVDLAEEVYLGPPISELIEEKKCSLCHVLLSKTIRLYPETFVASNGSLTKWERPQEIPLAEDSLVLDFENLYKDVKR